MSSNQYVLPQCGVTVLRGFLGWGVGGTRSASHDSVADRQPVSPKPSGPVRLVTDTNQSQIAPDQVSAGRVNPDGRASLLRDRRRWLCHEAVTATVTRIWKCRVSCRSSYLFGFDPRRGTHQINRMSRYIPAGRPESEPAAAERRQSHTTTRSSPDKAPEMNRTGISNMLSNKTF